MTAPLRICAQTSKSNATCLPYFLSLLFATPQASVYLTILNTVLKDDIMKHLILSLVAIPNLSLTV